MNESLALVVLLALAVAILVTYLQIIRAMDKRRIREDLRRMGHSTDCSIQPKSVFTTGNRVRQYEVEYVLADGTAKTDECVTNNSLGVRWLRKPSAAP